MRWITSSHVLANAFITPWHQATMFPVFQTGALTILQVLYSSLVHETVSLDFTVKRPNKDILIMVPVKMTWFSGNGTLQIVSCACRWPALTR